MFNKLELYLGALLIFVLICASKRIEEIFTELEIVSDLQIVPPKEECNVSYLHNFTYTQIKAGGKIPFEFRSLTPKVTWPVTDNNTIYTLYMAGITKSRMAMGRLRSNSTHNVTKIYPFGYEWHNWVVVNIPRNETAKGKILYPYKPLESPNEVKQTHRFAFLVYKQNQGNLTVDPPVNNFSYHFNELSTVNDFVKKYKLGDPVYGSVLLNEWVPLATARPDSAEN